MTLKKLIEDLLALSATDGAPATLESLLATHGDKEVVIEVYNGGDDVPCFVRPELQQGRILLAPGRLAD